MADDIWGTDPLATSRVQTPPLAQRSNAPVTPTITPTKSTTDTLIQYAAPIATKAATGFILPGTLGGAAGTGWLGLNAGGWVGKRTRYLVDGGMAAPEAEMQAYNEMQSITGSDPVSADFVMPEGSPMPDKFNGSPMNPVLQMKKDKVYIQQENAVAEDDRKNMAFDNAEKRKDEMHKLKMKQSEETHKAKLNEMRGPLGG